MAWPGTEENSYLNYDESADHDFHFPNDNHSLLSKFSAWIDKISGPFYSQKVQNLKSEMPKSIAKEVS